jgi:hypothetical protein
LRQFPPCTHLAICPCCEIDTGHLKETIFVQLVAFSFMCLLLVQFSGEFITKGFPHSLPLFGDSISQLAGVVLFNYAYIVTVPSWLNEKQNSVSVNSTIWHASTLSSAIYFGTKHSFDCVDVLR